MSYHQNNSAAGRTSPLSNSVRREAIQRFCERVKLLLEKRKKSGIATGEEAGENGGAAGAHAALNFRLPHGGGATLGPTSRYVDAVWQVWLEDMLQHNALPHYSAATGLSRVPTPPFSSSGPPPATTFHMEDASLLTLSELQSVIEGDYADLGYLVGHRVHPMLLEEELEAMTVKVEASSSYEKFKRYERRMKELNDARILRLAERRHRRKAEQTRRLLMSGQHADSTTLDDLNDDDDNEEEALRREAEEDEAEEDAYGRVPAIISASTMTAHARSVSMLWPAAGITRDAQNELNGGRTGFISGLRNAVASGVQPSTSMGGWASQPPLLLLGSTGAGMLPPVLFDGISMSNGFGSGLGGGGVFSTTSTSIFQEETCVSVSSSGSTNSLLALLPSLPVATISGSGGLSFVPPKAHTPSLHSMPLDNVGQGRSTRSTPSPPFASPLTARGAPSVPNAPGPGMQPRLHFNFDCHPPQVSYEWVPVSSTEGPLSAAAAAAGAGSPPKASKKIPIAPPRRVLDPCFLEVVLSRLPLLQSLVFCDTAMPLIDKDLMQLANPSFEHINRSVWQQLRHLSPNTAAASPLNDSAPSRFGDESTKSRAVPFASLQELRLLGCTLSGGEGSRRRLSTAARAAHSRVPKTPMRAAGGGADKSGGNAADGHTDSSSGAWRSPHKMAPKLSTTELTPRRVNGKVPPPAKAPGSPREFGPYGTRSNCLSATPDANHSSRSAERSSNPNVPKPPAPPRDRMDSGAMVTPRRMTNSPSTRSPRSGSRAFSTSPRLSRGGGGGGISPRMRSANNSVSSQSSSSRRRVKPTVESFCEDALDLRTSTSKQSSVANSAEHIPRHGSGRVDSVTTSPPRYDGRSRGASTTTPEKAGLTPNARATADSDEQWKPDGREGYYKDPKNFSENYEDSESSGRGGGRSGPKRPAQLAMRPSMDDASARAALSGINVAAGQESDGLRGGSPFGIEARELARRVRIGERRLLALEDGRAIDKMMDDYIASGYNQGHLRDLEWIACIPALKRLYLDRCSLQEQNMQWMESLPNLTLFSATHTNLRRVGFLRGVAGTLTDLNLSHCPWLPSGEELRALPLLEHLSLAFTPIHDTDFVTSCPRLVSLHLNGCRRLERVDAIGQLKELKVLNLSRTGIRTLSWIAQCSPQTLECVDVSYCESCPSSEVSVLGQVPKLRFLNISGMLLSSAARQKILLAQGVVTRFGYSEDQRRQLLRRLPKESHSHRRNSVSIQCLSLEWIKQCRHLEELWCLDAGDSVENIQVLASLSQTLRLLHLTHTKRIVTDLEWLSWGSNLTMLNLANHKALRDVSGLRELKKLKHLSLACTPIEDAAIEHLLPSAPTLHTLDVSYCRRLKTFSRLSNFKQLRQLYLSGTNVSRLDWVPSCSLLQRVQLNDCIQLRNVNPLQQLSRLRRVRVDYSPVIDLSWIPFLTKLEELNLAGCTNTVDYPLIVKCRNLKQLNLSYTCISETDWIRGLPHLQVLTLQHCSGVTHLTCLTSRRVTSLRHVDVEGSELVYHEKALQALKTWAEDAGVLLTWQPEDNFYPFDPNANPNANSATTRAIQRHVQLKQQKNANMNPLSLNSNRQSDLKRKKKQREGKENASLPPLQQRHGMPLVLA